MKKTIYGILKGKFLLDEGAYKKWSIIIFFSVLALIMIASSHSADGKVYQIAQLNEEVKALRSTYVDNKAELMELKMESFLRNKMRDINLFPSEKPPVKIVISQKKQKP